MKMRFQYIGIVLAAALGTAVARDGSGGYLTTVGPTLLRFQSAPAQRAVLPPLNLGENSDATQHGEGSKAPRTSPIPTEIDANPDSTQGKSAHSGAEQALPTGSQMALDANRSSEITAHMFLRFFAQTATNNQTGVVLMPLSFTPAQPALRLSSTAQYTTSKQ